MRILYFFTMASAILFTVLLIYLHTYTCFGQQNNLLNQNNFGKKPLGTPAAQSSSNTIFSKNLTGNGINGNTANLQGNQKLPGNQQQLTNALNARNIPPEQSFNLQQAMALQQMNIQPLFNLQQQTNNLPQAVPYNIPVSTNMQPSLALSDPGQNYNTPPASVINPLQGQQVSYQVPSSSGMPLQYSLQIPQAIPSYSVNSNYGMPSSPGCSTPVSIPVTIMESSQMYNTAPSFTPYTISQPSISNYYPSFDPNQSIMIGQNDIVLNNKDPLSSAYLSLLQTPSNPPQYRVVQSYPMNTVVTSESNQNSKTSSLKSLLPLIINLLKEKSNPCPCHSGCNCECKKKRAKKPQAISSNSKQKKYPLSEDGPAIELFSSELETIRNVREPKKVGKLKNKIPDESTETDDESLEYSEDDDDNEEE